MLESYQAFRASNAWDDRYDLPLCPINNNPWLYSAYADLLMKLHGEQGLSSFKVQRQFVDCENAVAVQASTKYDTGCFCRWPHGSDLTSWDEIVGAAHFSPWIAQRILGHLDRKGGDMNNTLQTSINPFRFTVYRLPFLRPYLLAAAQYDVSLFDQFRWSISLLWSAITAQSDEAGPKERNWIMAYHMKRFPLCLIAIRIWMRVVSKQMSPKQSFAIEPKDYPVFSEQAPDRWDAILD